MEGGREGGRAGGREFVARRQRRLVLTSLVGGHFLASWILYQLGTKAARHILVVRSFAGGKCEGILLPFTEDGVSFFLGCSADGHPSHVCSVLPRKPPQFPMFCTGAVAHIRVINAGGSVICQLLLPYSFHIPFAHPATRPPGSRVTILLSILLYLFPGRDLCLREANGQSRLL